MALRTVQPGELITSADWNELVDALGDLNTRVAGLESGGASVPPRITQVLPSGVRTAGDEIRIYGSNFGYVQGAHSVFFGNTRATNFLSGSSDTLLIVKIPNTVEGATAGGATITMSVGNLFGFATWAITIKSKPVVISGGVDFTYLRSRPTTPAQNASVLYDFSLHSTASQDLNVTISPSINIIPPLPAGVSDPGLGGFLTLLDADGTERPDGLIVLAEGATKAISLRLNVPDHTNGVKYSLSVTASATGVDSVTKSLPDQQVGQAGEQPDPTVSVFEYSSIAVGQGSFSTDTGGVVGVEGTLTVKRGTLMTIVMDATFAGITVGATNQYQLTATIQAPANGWLASVNPVMQTPQPVAGPGGSVDIYFDITAPASANTAILQLMLTRLGVATNNKRAVSYRLLTSA